MPQLARMIRHALAGEWACVSSVSNARGWAEQAQLLKLNPSVTHNHMDGTQVQAIFTDDVSLKVFMDSLVKLAVQK